MTIFDSINRSQSIVQHINSINSDSEIHNSLIALSKELTTLKSSAEKLQQNNQSTSTTDPPSIKSGCYIFANEKGFFCPNCYDNAGNKVPTKRLNSQLRVCPECRASIK